VHDGRTYKEGAVSSGASYRESSKALHYKVNRVSLVTVANSCYASQ